VISRRDFVFSVFGLPFEMIMKRNICCNLTILLGLALGSTVALAQQTNSLPATPSPEQRDAVTLEVLISEAWTNNPEVRLFAAAVAGARGELVTAKTWDNPQVSVTPGVFRDSGGNWGHAGFAFSQTILFPGKRALQRAVAEKTVESRQLALAAFRTQLAIQVHRSFYRLLAARQMVALRQRHMELAQSFLEAARKKVEGGFAPDFEQTKAEVDVAAGLKSLREAQADEAVARTALNSLVGRKLDASVKIEGEFSESPSVPDEETLLSHALAQNPSLKIQAAEVERTGLSLSLTKKSRLPDFTIGPTVEYQKPEQVYGFGISLPLPLWDKKKGAITTATAEQQRALAELDTLRRDIVREVSSAAHLLTAARESLAIYTPAFRGKLKAALDNASQSYAEGRTSLLVFLETERTYYDTEAGYYETLQRLYDAQAALEAGLGMPLNELEKTKPSTNK
jgi:cobalt-zinc-cadmium efflux system outer membrane protein